MNQLNVDCSACILWLEIISLLQTFGQNYQLFHLDSANYKVYEKDPSCISLGKIWTWPLCSWYKWLEWMESVRLRCNSNTTRGSWSFLALTFQVCVCLRMDTHTLRAERIQLFQVHCSDGESFYQDANMLQGRKTQSLCGRTWRPGVNEIPPDGASFTELSH